MSVADLTGDPHDLRHDPRVKAARLTLATDSLWATALINPLGTLIVCTTLFREQAVFGAVVLSHLFVAIALQVLSGVVAFVVQRRFAHTASGDAERRLRALILLQIYLSSSWGAVFWLLWRNGSDANNLLLTLVIVCVAWCTALLRSACPRMFLSGLAVLAAAIASRYATAEGALAHVLLLRIPMWIVFVAIMSRASERRTLEALIARFANEDLSDALRKARNVALEQRREAETANAAKTAFLANMSHELRTPLNAILGFSQIIAEESFGPVGAPRYREYAGDINTSGTHLLSLINDLLDVAKIEAGKMEIAAGPLDPAQALCDVARLMAPKAAAKSQTLRFPELGSAPWIEADERAFKQIALNLVSNAVKFTPEGGTIAVTAERACDGGFQLCCADNGPGISPDKISRVFQAFSQVDNRYDRNAGGTGLGLALVRGLAELHGGKAWIESVEGRGTKVFVYFPLAIDMPRQASTFVLSKF